MSQCVLLLCSLKTTTIDFRYSGTMLCSRHNIRPFVVCLFYIATIIESTRLHFTILFSKHYCWWWHYYFDIESTTVAASSFWYFDQQCSLNITVCVSIICFLKMRTLKKIAYRSGLISVHTHTHKNSLCWSSKENPSNRLQVNVS